jgi:DMSO/TMAO reductase YedYZ molybdopterin-dependent catalytic subunit
LNDGREQELVTNAVVRGADGPRGVHAPDYPGAAQAIEAVTPQRDFFVLAHLGIPRVDAADWRLEIAGLVERSR